LKWMLDTNTCIAIIKGEPAQAIKKLRGKNIGQVGLSSITLGELSFGAARSARREQNLAALNEFLLALEVAPCDQAVAFEYGELRAALERVGWPIGSLDTLIAAHALALDVVLVTNNTREFGRVEGLRVEDWLQS
jgi:tRNA(fMet)-specific endonuclease VapC